MCQKTGHAPAACAALAMLSQVDEVALTGGAAQEWGATAFESTLQLVTGRTHQIRAQLAAVGCPLLGDQLYTALASKWQQEEQQLQQQRQHSQNLSILQHEAEAGRRLQEQQQQQEKHEQHLQRHQRQQHEQQQEQVHRHAGSRWSKVYQEDPSRPIGLQAWKLQVKNINGRMDAALSCIQPHQAPTPGAAGSEQEHSVDQLPEQLVQEWVEFECGVPWWRA